MVGKPGSLMPLLMTESHTKPVKGKAGHVNGVIHLPANNSFLCGEER